MTSQSHSSDPGVAECGKMWIEGGGFCFLS